MTQKSGQLPRQIQPHLQFRLERYGYPIRTHPTSYPQQPLQMAYLPCNAAPHPGAAPCRPCR